MRNSKCINLLAETTQARGLDLNFINEIDKNILNSTFKINNFNQLKILLSLVFTSFKVALKAGIDAILSILISFNSRSS